MTFSEKTLNILNSGVTFHTRKGPGGTKFKYVKTEDVIDRLNEAFGHAWSSHIISTETSGDFVVILIQLTVQGVSKEAYGGAQMMRSRKDNSIVDLGNAYKSAFSNALKGAAKQFGIGLFEEDEDSQQPEYRPQTRTSTGKAHGTEVSASASTMVKVQPEKKENEDLLKKAKEMMARKKKEEEVEKAPVKPPQPESPFPSTTTSTDRASDIQVTSILKLSKHEGRNEAQLIESGKKAGVIKTNASQIKELTQKEGAAMIRFLIHRDKKVSDVQ